jgi:hypothetical protein
LKNPRLLSFPKQNPKFYLTFPGKPIRTLPIRKFKNGKILGNPNRFPGRISKFLRHGVTALAIADIYSLMFLGQLSVLKMAGFSAWLAPPPATLFKCRLVEFLGILNMNVSSYFMIGLTMEKVICIQWPLKRQQLIGKKQTIIGIITVWIYSISYSIIFAVVGIRGVDIIHNKTKCNYNFKPVAAYELVVNRIIVGVLHTGAALHLLFLLYSASKRRAVMMSATDSSITMSSQEKRFCGALIIINGMYIAVTFPHHCFMNVVSYNPTLVTDPALLLCLKFILYPLTFLSNPFNWIVIYGMNNVIRRIVLSVFKKME